MKTRFADERKKQQLVVSTIRILQKTTVKNFFPKKNCGSDARTTGKNSKLRDPEEAMKEYRRVRVAMMEFVQVGTTIHGVMVNASHRLALVRVNKDIFQEASEPARQRTTLQSFSRTWGNPLRCLSLCVIVLGNGSLARHTFPAFVYVLEHCALSQDFV